MAEDVLRQKMSTGERLPDAHRMAESMKIMTPDSLRVKIASLLGEVHDAREGVKQKTGELEAHIHGYASGKNPSGKVMSFVDACNELITSGVAAGKNEQLHRFVQKGHQSTWGALNASNTKAQKAQAGNQVGGVQPQAQKKPFSFEVKSPCGQYLARLVKQDAKGMWDDAGHVEKLDQKEFGDVPVTLGNEDKNGQDLVGSQEGEHEWMQANSNCHLFLEHIPSKQVVGYVAMFPCAKAKEIADGNPKDAFQRLVDGEVSDMGFGPELIAKFKQGQSYDFFLNSTIVEGGHKDVGGKFFSQAQTQWLGQLKEHHGIGMGKWVSEAVSNSGVKVAADRYAALPQRDTDCGGVLVVGEMEANLNATYSKEEKGARRTAFKKRAKELGMTMFDEQKSPEVRKEDLL
jgi:hypothetical protein